MRRVFRKKRFCVICLVRMNKSSKMDNCFYDKKTIKARWQVLKELDTNGCFHVTPGVACNPWLCKEWEKQGYSNLWRMLEHIGFDIGGGHTCDYCGQEHPWLQMKMYQ